MEALVSELSDSLLVNTEPRDTDTGPGGETAVSSEQQLDARSEPGPDPDHRLSQYKNQARLSDSQDARRRDLLHRQKRGRDARLDRLRALTSDDGDTGQDGLEEMDTAALPSAFTYRKKEYYQSQYSNQLMFSEWMEGKPNDLETDWLLKICPPGKRCLVVAKRRNTRSYTASGALLRTFPSQLPAGWRGPLGQRPTVLDCIWDERAATFHVLDLLCWNGHQVFDCETEFRFSWLQSKLSDAPEVGIASRRNPYRFACIPFTSCSAGSLAEAAANAGAAADGALFFHRAAHYRPGVTPLVLWLKPFMLPEAVGVPLTPEQLGAPPDYQDRAEFIQDLGGDSPQSPTSEQSSQGTPALSADTEAAVAPATSVEGTTPSTTPSSELRRSP